MRDDGDLLDAFLRAHREGDEAEAERLLEAAPTDALRRLMELRERTNRRAATPARGEDPEPGLPFERLGEFRLLRRIGEGGMGQLFLAEQESLGRTVALKVIQQSLLGSPTARERFRREALATARLHHPNLVTVFTSGEDQGVAYIAMEHVAGHGMDELIRDSQADGGRLGTRRVVRWGARLARALAYAHDRGVLHRDVKPSNVRIKPDDEPVLLDFGIARDERWIGRTVTEAFTGSLPYAAPEQLAGRKLDGRVDVYALAATIYEALTGRLPIPGGSSLEALLTNDATPPRRYNPSLSPDLQTVLLKALDKNPQARYADANSFADDLEAILELRPIAARPPHGLDRLRRLARRRPRLSAVGLSAAAALLLFAGYLLHAERERHRENTQQASRLVQEATRRLVDYREEQRGLADLEKRVVELQTNLHMRYTPPEEEAILDEGERRIVEARRNREATYHEVLELLRRARELDPEVARADEVRTDLYMQRWRDAQLAQDGDTARFFRDLVRKSDAGGRHADELNGTCRVNVDSDPPGADVHLFRLVEQAEILPGGERRYVPVPHAPGAPIPVPPGSVVVRVVSGPAGWSEGDLVLRIGGRPLRDALYVIEDRGTLHRGDRVLSINGETARAGYALPETADDAPTLQVARDDERIEAPAANVELGDARALVERGGVRAEVFRNGREESVLLPEGLDVRMTAIPLFLSEASRWATTPTGERILTRGRWLLVARRDGYRELRAALDTRSGWNWKPNLKLIPDDGAIPGFRRIHSGYGEHPSFWMMEREVTAAEYIEFLNDPETRARIDASDKPIYFPRDVAGEGQDGYWVREPGGAFRLAEDWEPDWPVLGVSWNDAQAYARWRTKRAQANGRPWRFALPDYRAWIRAANGNALSDYPFGDHFRPRWASSCYSRPKAAPEPVMSYPIDESVFGVYDMTGCAAEWLDDWYDEEKQLRRVGGGSWAHGDPEHLKLYGHGQPADRVLGTVGFRLVLREMR